MQSSMRHVTVPGKNRLTGKRSGVSGEICQACVLRHALRFPQGNIAPRVVTVSPIVLKCYSIMLHHSCTRTGPAWEPYPQNFE